MSNVTMKLPATVTSITINGNVKNADGAGNIVVDSADATNAIKASYGATGPCIMIPIIIPPTNPAT